VTVAPLALPPRHAGQGGQWVVVIAPTLVDRGDTLTSIKRPGDAAPGAWSPRRPPLDDSDEKGLDTMPKFERRLARRARDARGLTQSQVAARIGVPTATYVNWEKGKAQPRHNNGTLRIPRLSGHRFHGKLDTQSAGNWTLIPGQPGHLFQGKLDT